MLTSAGSGYSRFGELAVNRWREDVTKDNWGHYFYVRDLESSHVWSSTYQPTCIAADHYEVSFGGDRARFSREDHQIAIDTEIFVSPEDNVEIRQVTLANLSTESRRLALTSYFEVALATQGADVAHPAFSNLFVQTEFIPSLNTLLATRRPRSAKEKPVWLAQVIVLDRFCESEVQYETDRSKFIGRGRTSRNPVSILNDGPLSNTVGNVLDPSFSLRAHIALEPNSSSRVTFATICGDSKADVLNLAEQFQLKTTLDRAASQAWTQSQVQLHYLSIDPDEAHLFQRLATRLLFSDPSLRPASELIKLNRKDVTGLWAQGISGDVPILLVRIDDLEDRGLVRQLLKAHEYLGTKHLKFDLVILNEKANSYAQELQDTLTSMVHAATIVSHSALSSTRGKVFVLRGDLLGEQDRLVIYAMARISISSRQGSLSDQVRRTLPKSEYPFGARKAVSERDKSRLQPSGAVFKATSLPQLEFFNGLGGFDEAASEYVIHLTQDSNTPAPWLNVVSKPDFGFQVSESGSGFTWSMNSRENQLTPWSNDPVVDPVGEALFIKDLDSGSVWTPTALPIRVSGATYVAAHGQGYSRFTHVSNGIHSELTQFLSPHSSVKISRLQLRNESRGERKLSVTGYAEWVLGFSRATMAPTTITEFDVISKSVFAFNARSDEYGSRISFATFATAPRSYTCDRGARRSLP
jgi:cyclic beta-1,2-glucan synthetase